MQAGIFLGHDDCVEGAFGGFFAIRAYPNGSGSVPIVCVFVARLGNAFAAAVETRAKTGDIGRSIRAGVWFRGAALWIRVESFGVTVGLQEIFRR